MGHEGCEFGTIEPPMSARDRWQNNERVLLGDIPVNFRRMCGGVAEFVEQSLDVAKPDCSLRSLSVVSELNATRGHPAWRMPRIHRPVEIRRN